MNARILTTCLVISLLWLAACSTSDSGEGRGPVTDLQALLNQYAPTRIEADLGHLPLAERYALSKIIDASRYLDQVFLRQAFVGNPEIQERLADASGADARRRLQFFTIMKGPWDRQHAWSPFAIQRSRPAGGGFYPEDMSKAEFEAACKRDPEVARALKDLYAVVRRDERGQLVAVPYSVAFKQWLEPAASLLEGAAELTRNESLQRFLRSRAQAFRSNDYYQSDKDWMDLDSQVEVTIGPYEVYEDQLFAYKASFESFVTIADPKASADLERYKSELTEMEQALPVPEAYKGRRGGESPIRVADLVFAAGDARTSVQTLAFNLPNDERVRQEKGAKKVLLRNVIREKFNQIMVPIGRAVMLEKQQQFLSAEAFFNQTLFHELSHSMGPAYVGGKQEQGEVRLALEETYSPLEEAKADVMGATNVLYQVRKGAFPKVFRKQLLASYFIGLFRSVRFGLGESHGKGAAVQINSYLEGGAATWNAKTLRLSMDFDALEAAMGRLLTRLLKVQFEGDRSAAAALLAEKAVSSPTIKAVLGQLGDVPVDLRPIYPAAGEH